MSALVHPPDARRFPSIHVIQTKASHKQNCTTYDIQRLSRVRLVDSSTPTVTRGNQLRASNLPNGRNCPAHVPFTINSSLSIDSACKSSYLKPKTPDNIPRNVHHFSDSNANNAVTRTFYNTLSIFPELSDVRGKKTLAPPNPKDV